MKNQEFTETQENAKIELSDFAKSTFSQLIFFAVATLMASVSQEEFFSPLGIAFCSGISKEYVLFSSFGAMLGYILTQEYLSALRYIMALILVYILKVYVSTVSRLKSKNFVPPLISFFATFSTGLIILFTSPFNSHQLFLRIAEAISSFGSAYFIGVAFKSYNKIKENEHLTNREMTATIISIILFALTLARVHIFQVSPSGILCSFVIMCSAYLFHETGGAIIGTGSSIGFSLIGNSSPLVFCYSVSGLFAGLFSYSGRILCAMAYIFSYGATFLFFGGNKSQLAALVETAIASLIFILMPQKVFFNLKVKLCVSPFDADGVAIKNMMIGKLKMAKTAIAEMSSSIERVSSALQEKTPDKNGVYRRVRDNVCSDCATFDKCWKYDLSMTISEYDTIIDTIRKTGVITPSSLPPTLQNRCIRIMSLCDSFNKNYSAYSARLGAEGRINEMRKITADQFETVGDMIDDLLCDFQSDISPKSAKALSIKNSLEDLGITALVNYYEDTNSNAFISLTVKSSCIIYEDDIIECLERLTDKVFSPPTIMKNDTEKILLFCEKPYFDVECNFYQIPSNEDDICGDCFESFYDGKGNFIAVLSDGMGTGIRAAIDGTMASSLFSKLIISGFSFPCALRLVNAALLVKSREESLATLDILKINLYTGEAINYKAGATLSLLKRFGKVSEIKKSAMPIGILRQAEFGTINGHLKDGDTIIMMSDGATENSLSKIKAYVAENNIDDDLPQKLCVIAKSREISRADDITVATIKLKANKEKA